MTRNISESKKKRIAGKQFYKCANKPDVNILNLENYTCPLWAKQGNIEGSFDESGYEIDHNIEYSVSHDNSEENLQALCKSCHSVKTKRFMHKKNSARKWGNSGEEISPRPNDKCTRKLTKYQLFLKKEIPQQKKLHPGLEGKEYMKLAAKSWNKYKEENGIGR